MKSGKSDCSSVTKWRLDDPTTTTTTRWRCKSSALCLRWFHFRGLTSPAGPLVSPTGRPQSYSYSSTSSQRSWCALSSRLLGPVDTHQRPELEAVNYTKAPNYFSWKTCCGDADPLRRFALGCMRVVVWAVVAGVVQRGTAGPWTKTQTQWEKRNSIQLTWAKQLFCRYYRIQSSWNTYFYF